jgi:hypothetical protein
MNAKSSSKIKVLLPCFLVFATSLIELPLSAIAQDVDMKVFEAVNRYAADNRITKLLTDYRQSTKSRVWTAKSGTKLKAKYQGLNVSTGEVKLLGEDAKLREVAISLLSDDDVRFIERLDEIENELPKLSIESLLSVHEKQDKQISDLKSRLSKTESEYMILQQQLAEANKYAPSNKIANDNNIQEVDADKLEAFGSKLAGKPVRLLNVKFTGISNTWVTTLPGIAISSNGLITKYDGKLADRWVGFNITDQSGEHMQHMFAEKQEWAEFLINLKKGTERINITGVVVPLSSNGWHGVVVTSIEKAQ